MTIPISTKFEYMLWCMFQNIGILYLKYNSLISQHFVYWCNRKKITFYESILTPIIIRMICLIMQFKYLGLIYLQITYSHCLLYYETSNNDHLYVWFRFSFIFENCLIFVLFFISKNKIIYWVVRRTFETHYNYTHVFWLCQNVFNIFSF